MNNNFDCWWYLSVIANFAQVMNFQMNLKEVSNDEIMKGLLRQDKVLDEQTNDYLKVIIEQNEKIINLLEGGK